VPVSQDLNTDIRRLVTDRPKRCGREYTISGDSIVNEPITCGSTKVTARRVKKSCAGPNLLTQALGGVEYQAEAIAPTPVLPADSVQRLGRLPTGRSSQRPSIGKTIRTSEIF
jgi:hypothetical protein